MLSRNRTRSSYRNCRGGHKSGWAKVSHVPAINGLPGLKLAAVTTRTEQRAREGDEAFDADRWFSDPFAMIRDEQIDLVTIAVKVPAHRELLLAALAAGKAVYCEAPLGRTFAEVEEMARAVGSLHTAIGLQGLLNPVCAACGPTNAFRKHRPKRESNLHSPRNRARAYFHP